MGELGSRGFGWQSGEPPQVPDHELLCRIGGGSYGEVWLARSALGTLRAVKVVHRDRFEKERPYEREFEGLLHFEPVSRGHEGLVDILQVGRTESCFYCVMELADAATGSPAGQQSQSTDSTCQNAGAKDDVSRPASLISYVPLTLEKLARQSGPLPVRECVTIGLHLARALQFLHERVLVHRDIKPSNVIFVKGTPKLADVGLVARAEAGQSFVGTEGFVPPEGPGTAQADIYSLGKVLYEIAMGQDRLAFPSPPAMLENHPEKDGLLDLNEIILKACHPEPKQRYCSATEMAQDLQLLADGHSIRERRKLHRRRAALVVGSLAAAVIFGACAITLRPPVPEAPAPVEVGTSETTALIEVGKFALAYNMPAQMSRLCYFTGGEEPELMTLGADRILVTELDGQQVYDWTVPGFCKNPRLDLCVATEGDKREQPIISANDDHTNLFIVAFTSMLDVRQSFTNHGVWRTTLDGVDGRQGTFEPLLFIAQSNGPPLLLASYSDSRSTAYIRIYNFRSGVPLQDLPVTSVNGIPPVVADVNDDGVLDVIAGTYAPGNRLRTTSGLEDSNSYLLGLSWNGRNLWQPVRLGGPQTEAVPLLVHENGRKYVIVRETLTAARAALNASSHTNAGSSGEPWYLASVHSKTSSWRSSLAKFAADTGAEATPRYHHTNGFTTHLVTRLTADGPEVVLAADDAGWLHTFDSHLKLIRSASVSPMGTNSWSDLTLVGVADLDGDGQSEIVLQGAIVDAKSTVNWGNRGEPANDWFFYDCSVYVLDANSQLLAKHCFSVKRNLSQGTKVLLAPRETGVTEILVLNEKVMKLRFTRKGDTLSKRAGDPGS